MIAPAADVFEVWPVTMEPLDTLFSHPENFREHDVGAISESIRRWGVWRPLVVQKSSRRIIVGNGEYAALVAMGEVDEAPVRMLDVDDDNARAIMLADNWIPSRGRNMPVELLELMQQLQDERDLFESTGVDDDDVEALSREIDELDRPLDLDSRKMVRKLRKVECPKCGEKFEVGKK